MQRSTTGFILALGATIVAACGFPEVFIAGDTSGSGGGTTGSTTTSTASTGGAGGGSSSSSTSGTTTSTTSSTTSTTSSGGPCTTDDDGDGVISWKCNPADPAKDCADEDGLAYPDAGFEPAPIMGERKPGTQPFDFNCNGAEESEIGVLSCDGLLSCGTATGFQAAVQCGDSAPLGHCVASGLGCVWAALSPAQSPVQRCK
jgi:hypothetical protein